MRRPLVLVVDDDQDIRETLVSYLRRALEGVAVIGANGAKEAMQMLRLSHIDLVISDHYMPDGKGTDVLRFAHDYKPSVVRMLMTAFPEQDVLMKACNDAHVQQIFTKPLEPPHIAAAVSQRLEAAGCYPERPRSQTWSARPSAPAA